jgi:hypothetical protein
MSVHVHPISYVRVTSAASFTQLRASLPKTPHASILKERSHSTGAECAQSVNCTSHFIRMCPIARSGVTVTWLLCDPLPYKNVLKVPHAKNLGENTVLAFSTKCTKRSPRFSRVRYSGSGYRLLPPLTTSFVAKSPHASILKETEPIHRRRMCAVSFKTVHPKYVYMLPIASRDGRSLCITLAHECSVR